MQLTELIIRANVHAAAASLAIKAEHPAAAFKELSSLRDELTNNLTTAPWPDLIDRKKTRPEKE